MCPMSMDEDFWVFGYGSLIWRPDFPVLESRTGWVEGWARAFVQGSPDHRGTPDAPGRVVTLVAAPGSRVLGRLYRVPRSVLAHLDHREQAGYEHHHVSAVSDDGRTIVNDALLYVAGPGNPSWLGPAAVAEAAREVLRRVGPSGTNLEYVEELGRALSSEGVDDPAVHELAAAVGEPRPGPLVVTTCSASKDAAAGCIPALARYRSPRIDAVVAAAAAARSPTAILSGRFGLLSVRDPIPNYDAVLSAEEVDAAARGIAERLRAWDTKALRVHLRPPGTPGWAPYREAILRGAARAGIPTTVIDVPPSVPEFPAPAKRGSVPAPPAPGVSMSAIPETVAVFDAWARSGRAEGMERGHGPRAAVAIARIPLTEGDAVLDLGCGNGWATRTLRAAVGPHGSAIGLDAAPEMIERATAMSSAIPGIRFVRGAFEGLDFADDSFDHVFSFEALYYSSDLDRSFAEIRRVLRPGGTLTVGTDHYLENVDSHSWSADLGIPMEMMDEAGWAARIAGAGFTSVTTFRCLDPRPVDHSIAPERRDAVRRFRTEVGTLGIFAR